MSRRGKTQTRIVVAKEDWSVRSMPWQLVADGSSFYLHPERALYKVSLHGPKGEDWSQAHMRVDYLQGQKDDQAGQHTIVPVDGFDMPVRFEGVPVRRGVVHALRLRFPYWALNKRGPQPPMPEDTSSAREARLRMSPASTQWCRGRRPLRKRARTAAMGTATRRCCARQLAARAYRQHRRSASDGHGHAPRHEPDTDAGR
jgi:hypothetical protein